MTESNSLCFKYLRRDLAFVAYLYVSVGLQAQHSPWERRGLCQAVPLKDGLNIASHE